MSSMIAVTTLLLAAPLSSAVTLVDSAEPFTRTSSTAGGSTPEQHFFLFALHKPLTVPNTLSIRLFDPLQLRRWHASGPGSAKTHPQRHVSASEFIVRKWEGVKRKLTLTAITYQHYIPTVSICPHGVSCDCDKQNSLGPSYDSNCHGQLLGCVGATKSGSAPQNTNTFWLTIIDSLGSPAY